MVQRWPPLSIWEPNTSGRTLAQRSRWRAFCAGLSILSAIVPATRGPDGGDRSSWLRSRGHVPVLAGRWPSRTGLLDRERPQAGVGWQCTSQPSPCRMRHAEYGGRSRPRPQVPVRHGCVGGCGTNAMTPATCEIDMLSGASGILVHNDPDVSRTPLDRHRGARKNCLHVTASRPKNCEAPARPVDGVFPARFRGGNHALRVLLLAEKASLRDLSVAQIVQSIERGIERWHARNEVGAPTAPANGAGTG